MDNKEERKAKIGLVAKLVAFYFVLMPLDSVNLFGLGSFLKYYAIVIIGIVILLQKNSMLEMTGAVKWLLLYLFVMAASGIYTINLSESINQIIRLLQNIAFIICVGSLNDKYNNEEYNLMLKGLIIGGILNVILTFIFSDTSGTTERLTIKIAGSRQDQNYLNGYSLVAVAYFLKKLVSEKKILAAIPILINIIFTLMTGSRGGLLSIAAIGLMTIIYTFFVDHDIKPGTVLIIALVLILFIIHFQDLLALISPTVAQRFSLEYIQNYNGLNRSDLWVYLFSVYGKSSVFRKIFGYGIGTVINVNQLTFQVAHNFWLEHLIANGIVGLIIVVGMQFYFLREAFKKKDIILVSTFIGLLTMCFTLSLTSYKPIWNLFLMIMIRSRMQTEKSNQSMDIRQNRYGRYIKCEPRKQY